MRGLLFLFLGAQVWASSVGDHAKMTRAAVEQFEACFSKKISKFALDNIIYSNVDEDIDVVTKWLVYSHYYNPYKDVSTWRKTGMDRVRSAQEKLEKWKGSGRSTKLDVQNALSWLGHIMHQIQDSTVPAHVVPVLHWLHDSFEIYEGHTPNSLVDCRLVKTASKPTELFHESASQTLESLSARIDSQNGRQLTWQDFWHDTGEKFGSYGMLGNSFGSSEIITRNGMVKISPEIYEKFWHERRQQSVLKSAQLLYWFFCEFLPSNRIAFSDGEQVDLFKIFFN